MPKILLRARFRLALLFTLCVLVNTVCAQSNESIQQSLNESTQTNSIDISKYQQSTKSTGRYNSAVKPNQTDSSNINDLLPSPYGANLFYGGYTSERSDGLNEFYLVAPGDKIAVQLWGTVSQAEVLTVDNQGNIFILGVGPIAIEGTPATQVNQVVTQKIKSVYTNNVNVYVNLLTTTPVSIFVSGPVTRPGQYAGLASDSVLFFLSQAGGIDSERGSYRKIDVLRNNQVIKSYDLYQFLREGKLDDLSFQDGDVILVSEQGSMVTVAGAVRYPFRFELSEGAASGQELMYYARPLAKVSHVGVIGDRADSSVAVYLPIKEFGSFAIGDGDIITFNDDLRPNVISVKISGSFIGPSIHTLQKDVKLVELLDYIEVNPEQADIKSIYIKRQSVIKQQKELLEDSLRRLERSIFTAPASSDGEARIRAQEAELVMQFVTRARKIEPLGKVVLAENGQIANIHLEQDDEIVIPLKTDLIQVSGEVLMPQAVVYNPNATVNDYISWAGGYSDRANSERVAIIHASGLLTFVDSSSWFGNSAARLKPGDKILILPKVDTKVLQAIKDITQIVYQVAVAANVALN